jgi:predicted 3-demethylubiquinone-9 3-methyltransferase (glyoxalase superfamily)
MQRITPFLWFNDNAEEAAAHYVSVFSTLYPRPSGGSASRIVSVMPGASPGKASGVTFHLEGQEFIAFNGGPHMTFSPAISLFVRCETQSEVDELWRQLSHNEAAERCGWLRDKYGVSWQIIPAVLTRLMQDPDREKAARVTQAMLRMKKIDIAKLEAAAAGH